MADMRGPGALLVAVLLVGGCAAADPPLAITTTPSTSTASSSTTAGASAAPAPSPTVRTVAVTVTGKRVSPAPAVVRVRADETLRLVVTSDDDDDLHAHGFDVQKALVAGEPLILDLRGAAPGQYEVETHDPPLRLLVVQVR